MGERCRLGAAFAAVLCAAVGCSRSNPTAAQQALPLPPGVRVPLTDMGLRTYENFVGGLYPGPSNAMPSVHANVGGDRATLIRTRDVNGNPSASGKYVLLSIGMSNTTQEFSAFITAAAADAAVDKTRLAIVDGAAGGKTADFWTSPTGAEYERIRTAVLQPRGLGEAQVAAVWLKVANSGPTRALPDPAADAFTLVAQQGNILRSLKVRYPNLQLVFASSRIYAGYASTTLNPEPYAYESGFAVKWLVGAQINQMAGASADSRAGDLNYDTVAPWVAWGPYLWADGMTARGDGLTWASSDFAADGTHPATTGRQKVATLLLDFFKTAPQARCWFLAGQVC
jgi:hypothetical protein